MRRAACGLIVGTLLAACSPTADTLIVGAASSLADVMPALVADYEQATGDAVVTVSFAGSQLLAAQVLEGAPFDMVITADRSTMDRIAEELISEPIRLAGNRLTIAVAAGNPLGINGPADLLDPGLVVVVADFDVPAGSYTAEALERARLDLSPASREPSARAVLARVESGEADAGIVYATDVLATGRVQAVPGLPEVEADYLAALLSDSTAARSFSEYLQSHRAQSLLGEFGFSP